VIEDVRARAGDDLQALLFRVKIGRQHFDDDPGCAGAHGFDGAREMERAAVFQIIPRDGGDDDVLELHPDDGLRDALRARLPRARTASPSVTAQKPQARVQRSPAIMKVAVPALQHSQRFGHCASSQTVCSLRSEMRPWSRRRPDSRAAAP
jgi:hypothetical protein